MDGMRTAAIGLVLLSLTGCKLAHRDKHDASARSHPHAVATLPAGYVKANVLDVVPTTVGDAVLLEDDTGTSVLPIFVGGTEAMTIKLRLEGKHYKRPLTHDLLSDVMKDLGASAVKVQVDDLRNDTFYGSAFIEKGDGTVVDIDARPSDCIALALGEKVPIYVKKDVFDAAGIPRSEIEQDGATKKKKGDPLSL
jgi:hypothetical protein